MEYHEKSDLERENDRLREENNSIWWAVPIIVVLFLGMAGYFSPSKNTAKYDETSNYVLCLQHPEDFRPHKCSEFK